MLRNDQTAAEVRNSKPHAVARTRRLRFFHHSIPNTVTPTPSKTVREEGAGTTVVSIENSPVAE
jgi:hypothetical protein